VPSLALNLLSSNPQMYSGLFQYSAEIVPVLIFATIEGLICFFWLLRYVIPQGWCKARQYASSKEKRVGTGQAQGTVPTAPVRESVASTRFWTGASPVSTRFCGLLFAAMLASTLATDYRFYGVFPLSQGFQWPQVSGHTSEVDRFLRMLPPDASVSAQNKFVPHLSQRAHIYLFPYQADQAEYILLDTTGDVYPLTAMTYREETQKVLHSGHYRVLLAENGYLLLQRIQPTGASGRGQAHAPTGNALWLE
jgi:hypothetical protein